MSKSENNRRQGTTPPSRRRRSTAPASSPRKKVSPSKDHISGKESISSKKSGKSKKSVIPKRPAEDLVKEEASLGFPGGEVTLLEVPHRKPLPQLSKRSGRKCILEEIVTHNPDLYAKLIGLIRLGNSANVAAEKVGINENTFWSWAYKGASDEEAGVDSYFSRFNRDIRRAVAHMAADCEQAVVSKSPQAFLRQGMGRIFGNWTKDNPGKRQIPGQGPTGQQALPSPQAPDEAIDAVFTVISQRPVGGRDDELQDGEMGVQERRRNSSEGAEGSRPSNGNEGSSQRDRVSKQPNNGQTLSLTAEQEYGALSVWDDMGLITMAPELKHAFSEQSSK